MTHVASLETFAPAVLRSSGLPILAPSLPHPWVGLLCGACAIAIFAAMAPAQSWTSLGPINEAGVMRRLQVHEPGNKLFASSPDGGLWVSTIHPSEPMTWTPISDFLDNIEIRAFAVHPSNADVIYVATNDGSFYETANGGTRWNKLKGFSSAFGRINDIVVSPDGSVLTGTKAGLYRASHDGLSWTHLYDKGNVLDIAIDPDDPSIIYIGVAQIGLLKTIDGGSSPWQVIKAWPQSEIPKTNHGCMPPRTTPSQVIRISLGERRANRLVPGVITDGIRERSNKRTVALKFGKHIYVSSDAGANFTPCDSDLITDDGAGNYLRSEDYIDDDWANALAVDPFDSTRILLGQNELFMTTDGGKTWTKVDSRAHEDCQDIQFSRTTRDLIFLANDGGVERSNAPNTVFSRIYDGLATSQLFRCGIKGTAVVGNSDHNGVIGTSDSAERKWQQIVSRQCGYGNNGMEKSDVYKDPKRANRFYFVFRNQLARVNYPFLNGTTCCNNTSRFTPFLPYRIPPEPKPGLRSQQPIAVDIRQRSQLILVASDIWRDTEECGACGGPLCPPPTGNVFNLMVTFDGDTEPTGDTYAPQDLRQPTWEITAQRVDDPFVSVVFMSRATGKNAYAITRSGALYTASIPVPAPAVIDWAWKRGFVPLGADGVRHFAPSPTDEDTVVAITKTGVATTFDGGKSWTIQTRPMPSAEYYSIVLDATLRGVKCYVGTSDGVYRSSLTTGKWTKWNGKRQLPNVKVVQLVRTDGRLYAVTYGRGLWASALSKLGL